MLSRCDLLRHLPPEEIEAILPRVRTRRWGPGQILFRAGDPGDALYIVASGKVDILEANASADQPIAEPQRGRGVRRDGAAQRQLAHRDGPVGRCRRAARGSTGRTSSGWSPRIKVLAAAVERLSHNRATQQSGSAGTPLARKLGDGRQTAAGDA